MTQDPHMKDIPSSQSSLAGARFTLKKRPIKCKSPGVNISSYNSDFLDGLFADVAKVSDPTEKSGKRSSDAVTSETDCAMACSPFKKSRSSLHGSLVRVQTSSKNLLELLKSPKGINEFFRTSSICPQANTCLEESSTLGRNEESLQFQLNCVSQEQSSAITVPKPTAESAAKLAFPNLPATVSDSSCNAGLTRVNLVRQASIPEKSNKDSFGWFVDLDDNQAPEANSSLPYVVSSDSLAFQAPTAPKTVHDHEELEWAKAADTVDDVLGAFF